MHTMTICVFTLNYRLTTFASSVQGTRGVDKQWKINNKRHTGTYAQQYLIFLPKNKLRFPNHTVFDI